MPSESNTNAALLVEALDKFRRAGNNRPVDGDNNITPEGVSDKFRDYLVENGISRDTAATIADHLEEFLRQYVPDLNALSAVRTLREISRSTNQKQYPKYRDREDYGITDIFEWYDRFYRDDVEKGVMNTTLMMQTDRSFAHYLSKALEASEGGTLADFMRLRQTPSARVQAMSVILDMPPERAASFLQARSGGGRPRKG